MPLNVAAQCFTRDSDAAVAEICAKVPELEEAARAFALLADAQQRLKFEPAEWPGECVFDAEAFNRGEPLWAGRDFSGLNRSFLDAAVQLLPTIERVFPQIAPDAFRLRTALVERPGLGMELLEAVRSEEAKAFEASAEGLGIPLRSMEFLVLEILKPCLRRAAEWAGHSVDFDLWCESYCPVCGSGPDFGFLKEKRDPSEFLISKAGRLWLHCSLCGSVWRFVRLVCPSCGQEDQEQLEVLTVGGMERERIHACHSCGRYLLVIDLVERQEKLHPDLAPLGLVPLDILAQERGYQPLVQTPWNRFS